MPTGSQERWRLRSLWNGLRQGWRRMRVSFHLSKWMPWVFFGIILVLVYHGIADIVVMAADAHDTATLTAAELKDRIDELKWILGLIVTTAGLFTVAQGIAAGFNAQNFNKQAENSLTQLENIQKEVKARYTIYSQLAELWANAYVNMTVILQSDSPVQNPDEGFHWRRGFYEKLPLKIRQELISAEQIVPYEITGQNESAELHVLKLRRLARFYWSKFIYDRTRGSSSLGDLEHAEYLLELAMRKIGPAFYLQNDMGNIYIEHFRALSKSLPTHRTALDLAELKKTLDHARQSFADSIAAQKEQLRAYFDLASIEADLEDSPADKEKNLGRAIGYLRDGLQYPKWEHEPVDEFTCNALYNLACFHARLVSPKRKFAEKATMAVLRKAAKIGLVSKTDVARDFNTPDGDFQILLTAATPEKKLVLKRLERELTRNYR